MKIKALKSKIPSSIKQKVRRIVDPEFRNRQDEIKRLEALPRRQSTTTNLLGEKTEVVDAASFLSAYRAIFESEIYDLKTNQTPPKIIDGGANIGLALIYWKRKFPNAEIIAFEPDAEIFDALKTNVEAHGCENVELVEKGLWSETTTLRFSPDGADGGHVEKNTGEGEQIEVSVTRLVPYLDEQIDLLKLDIEGAEVEVLTDAAGHLDTVQNLFVEYHSYIGKEQRIDEILHVLRQAGFRIHIQPELVADQPFVERRDSYGMDQRLNIFAYRG